MRLYTQDNVRRVGLSCLGCRRFNEGDQAQAHWVNLHGLLLSDPVNAVMWSLSDQSWMLSDHRLLLSDRSVIAQWTVCDRSATAYSQALIVQSASCILFFQPKLNYTQNGHAPQGHLFCEN
jgi:hypothetical protein